MKRNIVVVGGGQAGYQVLATLRAEGFDGGLTFITAEACLPYQRPPLSKAYMKGEADADKLVIRPEEFYTSNDIEIIAGVAVESIDRAARRVALADGRTLAFDGLALTVGARPRQLPVAGSDLDGVVVLRDMAHADDIRQRLEACTHVAVIGGGFIGLEAAAVMASLGKSVSVIEALPRLMARAVSPTMSAYFADFHRRLGVEVVLNSQVKALDGENGRVRAVALDDGRKVAADLAIVGIGVVPNQELAQAAGLACDNGIIVDEFARTSDRDIVAAGDCATHPNRFAGGMFRLESVQNATDQAKTAARTLLGKEQPYDTAPWFWSDQADAKLQMVGLCLEESEDVMRGDPATGRFSVFRFAGGALRAIESVNRPGDHMAGRRIFALGRTVSAQQASDENFDLKTLVR